MNVDPSGHFFLLAFIFAGLLAFGATVYADYKDDGEVFNGSIAWYDYLGITLLSGLTGGLLGTAFGGASFSFGIPTLGLTTSGSALAIGVAGTATITITGTQILTGLAVAGGLYLFARTGKSNGYWGEKYSIDHAPDHFHFKGTDGTDIRMGLDGNPLKGENGLTAQQRKALKNLWKQIMNLFK